jgi:hypothetical protein
MTGRRSTEPGPLDGWAALDPKGVLPRLVPLARGLPGIGLLERQVERAERALLSELKRIEDAPEGHRREAGAAGAAETVVATPAQMLDALLTRSMHQTPSQSLGSLVERRLSELVPDEARILAALADGSTYPLVHVHTGGVGAGSRRVLANASSVGRAAGVALPQRVPVYVNHLRQLGLVETGPEDTARGDEYDILLTEPVVRAALQEARGRMAPRIVRRTVRISDLGRELWAACRPEGGGDGSESS